MREAAQLAVRQRVDVDRRAPALEADVGKLAPVRRPVRRHQRLGRGCDRHRIGAVGVDHAQVEPARGALPRCRDVGDLRAEIARRAGERLVHEVGDLVGDAPRPARVGRADVVAREHASVAHVGDLEPREVRAGLLEQAAHHDVVHAERAPRLVLDLGGRDRLLRQLVRRQHAERAGAGEVSSDHAREARAGALGLRERHHGQRPRAGLERAAADLGPGFGPRARRHAGGEARACEEAEGGAAPHWMRVDQAGSRTSPGWLRRWRMRPSTVTVASSAPCSPCAA